MLIYLCIVCGLHMEVRGQPKEVVGFVFFPLREMGSKDRAHMARSGYECLYPLCHLAGPSFNL